MSREVLLAIDPGRSKTGLALVSFKGEIIKTDVILMENFLIGLRNFCQGVTIEVLVLGNGTTSESMNEVLKEEFPSCKLYIVEESYSTEEARKLYWELNPPQGLKRLIPLGLRVPPINLDGLAAAVLGKRYLQNKKIQ